VKTDTPAERAFHKGMEALKEGDSVTATALFESAMLLERERGIARTQMRYLSFY
jgi:hypothetical protein